MLEGVRESVFEGALGGVIYDPCYLLSAYHVIFLIIIEPSHLWLFLFFFWSTHNNHHLLLFVHRAYECSSLLFRCSEV